MAYLTPKLGQYHWMHVSKYASTMDHLGNPGIAPASTAASYAPTPGHDREAVGDAIYGLKITALVAIKAIAGGRDPLGNSMY